jgi:hypothetical protein
VNRHVGFLLRILFGVVWSRGLRELDVDGSRATSTCLSMMSRIDASMLATVWDMGR